MPVRNYLDEVNPSGPLLPDYRHDGPSYLKGPQAVNQNNPPFPFHVRLSCHSNTTNNKHTVLALRKQRQEDCGEF